MGRAVTFVAFGSPAQMKIAEADRVKALLPDVRYVVYSNTQDPAVAVGYKWGEVHVAHAHYVYSEFKLDRRVGEAAKRIVDLNPPKSVSSPICVGVYLVRAVSRYLGPLCLRLLIRTRMHVLHD